MRPPFQMMIGHTPANHIGTISRQLNPKLSCIYKIDFGTNL